LLEQFQQYGIEGAFLIGDLPYAEYEDTDYGQQFPCDIYLMDLDQSWTDSDGNGKLDGNPRSPLEIFISRIIGTSDEINKYFAKAHQYRTTGSLVSEEALVFMDSHTCDEPCYFGLDWIYSKTDFIDSFVERYTPEEYIERLSQETEYVAQWIHSTSTYLQLSGGTVTIQDIEDNNFKGSFYLLNNGSASRFTEQNLAMTYLLKTDYGLATFGMTGVGILMDWYGIRHESLSIGENWGTAFLRWFNEFIVVETEVEVPLVAVILGDPLLTIFEDNDL